MKYLVTSATGDLAFQSVQFLLTLVDKNDVVVTVRDLEKAEKLKVLGVEIRQADYLDESSLVEAFTGVSRVLFISSGDLSSRARQHRNVVNALISANVQFVAYTSAPKADQSTAIVAPDHQLTEELIMASGLNYAFLRNNWYLENEGMLFDAIEQKQPFVYVTGSGRAGWAKKSDYAEAAARILAGVVPSKLIYELGGQPITYPELADVLQGNREEKIALIPESAEEYAEQLKSAGLPEEVIGFIIGIQKDIKNGQLDVPSDDLEVVLGRPLTELTI